jgi:glycolate oxidase FAD binding subunit
VSPSVVPTATPANEEEAAEAIRAARRDRVKLDIVGGGTRCGLGRPREGLRRLATTALSGIVFHAPAEMALCAKAGTPLATIEAALGPHGQMLPFEPMRAHALYGEAGEPSLGGLVAANVSGPRRVSAGAARDSVIGLSLVNGLGQTIKSGGRVMKNVTGLDLVKLNCGAHGTLGLIAEATVKLLPRPEIEATIVVRRLDDSKALDAMTRALGSPFGVSGAASIRAGMGREFPRTLIRLEGFAESVDYRVERLIALLADLGAKHDLRGEESARMWRAIRDVEFLVEPRERAIWRVHLAPSRAPGFLKHLGAVALDSLLDWGGGLVWIAAEASEPACEAVRAATLSAGGHATLVRAPDELRARVAVFEPPSPIVLKLSRGVKASFDPDAILNFGRMIEGV